MKGSDIRAARKKKGWTQRELSDASGVNYVSISRIETGLSHPQPSTCRKLAKALGVPYVPPPLHPQRVKSIKKAELVAQISALNLVQRARVQGYIDALIEEAKS